MNKLAIVLVAYNRSESLKLLMDSLLNVKINQEIPLIISIDNNGTNEVNQIANEYNWPYGEKTVVIHNHKKGLVNHFIWAGNQTEFYENVIILEDDLLVSPGLVSFSTQLIDFFKNDAQVAAVSLYNPIINQLTGTRFYQIPEGNDVYFLQQPYWGNIWFRDKWQQFAKYLDTYKENKALLPKNIAIWRESFKKIYIQFLIENEFYMATPRTSIVTNQCIAGLHSSGRSGYFHTAVETEEYTYKLKACKSSLARYDAFMEIEGASLKHFNKTISLYEFDVDINGTRFNYTNEYVLTTKPAKKSIMTFSSIMKPQELSILFDIHNEAGIKLCKKEDILDNKMFSLKRRFIDIRNNYHIGVVASFFIFLDSIKYIFELTRNKISKILSK